MSLRGDAIRQAGANKAVRPFRSDFESIGLPFFLILFEAGQIENEMQK